MSQNLILLLLALPLFGAILTWIDKKEDYSSYIFIITTALIGINTFFIYKEVIIENKIIITYLPIAIYGISFAIDGLSYIFISITALIWFLSSLFGHVYMKHENNKRRYYTFSLLVLMSNLGVLISKDLFSLFIFFELMGFLSYILIIHSEKKDALFAGKKYLIMTIIGGLSLLFGVFLYFYLTGTMDLYSNANSPQAPFFKPLCAFALIAGFGVKAGMFPLHIWLPDAHPSAPTPASAVLSGVIIKTGAYGIIRITQLQYFTNDRDLFATNLGFIIIWVGIITMFIGVVLALLQSNAKRLLAYHSVSQMGYILMGIGCALYLGKHGTIGLAGSIYHIVNHALFKSSLFFTAGAVYLQTKDYNLYNLGGLRHKMPYLAVFTIIAACGIGGIPIFNGYISKTLLHHAILEAYKQRELMSLNIAEKIFMITSAGTLCSFIKFTGFIFFGEEHSTQANIKEPPFLSNLSSAILALIIISLGIFPQFFIQNFISPALNGYYKEEFVSHLFHLSFFNLHDLSGVIFPVLGGSAIFYLGIKFGIFHLHIPPYIGVDYWYTKTAEFLMTLIHSGYSFYKKIEYFIKDTLLSCINKYKKIHIEISFNMNNFFEYYRSLCITYNQTKENFCIYFSNSFVRVETAVIEFDVRRIEFYQQTKLKFGYMLLKNWMMPFIEAYHPEENNIEGLKKSGRNLETLFNLKEKIDQLRYTHKTGDGYSFMEIETILEEKNKILNQQKEIYFKAMQRMLQYYTSDIKLGVFLIIVVISLYFALLLLKI